jgi:MFS superfamily sulfate permease-like transporter
MSRWKHWLPELHILSEYQAGWFGRDLMAGLMLTAMLVPVGIMLNPISSQACM